MGPQFVTVQRRPRVAMAVAEDAGEGEGRARPARQVAKKVLWHERLGHLHEGGMNDLVNKDKATGVDFQAKAELPVCESCAQASPSLHCSTATARPIPAVCASSTLATSTGPFVIQEFENSRSGKN